MTTSISNAADIAFLLREVLDVDELFTRPRFASHSPETVQAMLALVEELAANEVAPHLRSSDEHEPWLDDGGDVKMLPGVTKAVRKIAEAGLFSTVFDEELGGLQLPYSIHFAALGMLMGGAVGIAAFPLLTVGNARLIATYGSEAQIAAFAKPQIAGAAMGTMCLSESQAGSSLADITTRATPDGEDALGHRFRLRGDKMWISAGDHDVTANIVHLVLAKIPDDTGALPAGTKGISLFIVPKLLDSAERNDISVVGLNHKMGFRATPNCALTFGDGRFTPDGRPGAVGWLIGERGQGLAQMFQMMNESRVAVGLGAAMLAGRGFLSSLAYARERRQGRAAGVRSGDPVPIVEHADVRRMLLAQKCLSEGSLALVLYAARLLDEEATAPAAHQRDGAGEMLALLTPIVKSWPSEWAQHSLNDALQILGGAGYTRDFDIELLYRDNRLNPIHEGATGIQAIDLVSRKIRREGGRTLGALAARIHDTIQRAAGEPRIEPSAEAITLRLAEVEAAATRLIDAAEAEALAHATPFLFAFGHLVVGWLWLEQAAICARALTDAAPDTERNFRLGKIAACRYFAEYELPKITAWLAPLMASSDTVLTVRTEQFVGDG